MIPHRITKEELDQFYLDEEINPKFLSEMSGYILPSGQYVKVPAYSHYRFRAHFRIRVSEEGAVIHISSGIFSFQEINEEQFFALIELMMKYPSLRCLYNYDAHDFQVRRLQVGGMPLTSEMEAMLFRLEEA